MAKESTKEGGCGGKLCCRKKSKPRELSIGKSRMEAAYRCSEKSPPMRYDAKIVKEALTQVCAVFAYDKDE